MLICGREDGDVYVIKECSRCFMKSKIYVYINVFFKNYVV